MERGEVSRKERSDKKWQYPLRLPDDIASEIKAIALTCDKPIGQVLEKLIIGALRNQEIMDSLYAMWPPKDVFVIVRGRRE